MGLPAALGFHDLDRRIHADQFPEEEMAVRNAKWRMWNAEWGARNAKWRMRNAEWVARNAQWRMRNAKDRVYVEKMKIFIPNSALCIPHFEGKDVHHD